MARKLLEARLHRPCARRAPAARSRELDVEVGTRRSARLRRRWSAPSPAAALVFHVAADYRLWAKDPERAVPLQRGRHAQSAEAARASAGVERVVYTSTVGCIGIPHGRPGDEDSPVSLEEMSGRLQAIEVSGRAGGAGVRARSGFPVVIVNPTAPVGDHDFKPTPTGKIVVDFLKGDMPAFVDTGLNVVDVRDTAEGHCWPASAAARASATFSDRENLTLAADLETAGARSPAARRPRWRIPYAVAYAAGRGQHRLGESDRTRSRARRIDAVKHGPQENVRFARQGEARTGIQSGPGGRRAETRRGLVSGATVTCPNCWLFVAAEARGIRGLAASCRRDVQARTGRWISPARAD